MDWRNACPVNSRVLSASRMESLGVSHRHRPVERLTSPAVEQPRLPVARKPGEREHILDLGLACPVEYRRRHGNPAAEIVRELAKFVVVQGSYRIFLALDRIHVLQESAKSG
jgi:hypothetical protein